MATLKENIIFQASIIIGNGLFITDTDERINKISNLAKVFVDSVMEDVFLSVRWHFAIKTQSEIVGRVEEFIDSGISDCLRVINITPGATEWYIDGLKLYIKGDIERVFYHSNSILQDILSGNEQVNVSNSYTNLCGLNLASQIAHSGYSDSAFTDGLKAQYLRKLLEVQKLHYFECHITNSANF